MLILITCNNRLSSVLSFFSRELQLILIHSSQCYSQGCPDALQHRMQINAKMWPCASWKCNVKISVIFRYASNAVALFETPVCATQIWRDHAGHVIASLHGEPHALPAKVGNHLRAWRDGQQDSSETHWLMRVIWVNFGCIARERPRSL